MVYSIFTDTIQYESDDNDTRQCVKCKHERHGMNNHKNDIHDGRTMICSVNLLLQKTNFSFAFTISGREGGREGGSEIRK